MKRRALFAVLAAALLIALGGSESAGAQQQTLQFLSAADVDPLRLLPTPPADGSPENQAELAELRRIAAETAPDRWDQAKWDAEHENGTIFQSAIAPGFSGPAATDTERSGGASSLQPSACSATIMCVRSSTRIACFPPRKA